jgi:hypothetical protein
MVYSMTQYTDVTRRGPTVLSKCNTVSQCRRTYNSTYTYTESATSPLLIFTKTIHFKSRFVQISYTAVTRVGTKNLKVGVKMYLRSWKSYGFYSADFHEAYNRSLIFWTHPPPHFSKWGGGCIKYGWISFMTLPQALSRNSYLLHSIT